MSLHEYALLGLNRTNIGRYLGAAGGFIAATFTMVGAAVFQLADKLGWSQWLPGTALLPITAIPAYAIGHWAFDTWLWKLWIVRLWLKVPNLEGKWHCNGETRDLDGNVTYNWTATVTIAQTWEKIRVSLNTGQSQSRSVAAALLYEPGIGYRLMYSYRNEPRTGEPELRPHRGYCEIIFSDDLKTAEGDYFNNNGRVTFGRMALTRKDAA